MAEKTIENKLIKIGATVNWRGGWGNDPAKQVRIIGIDFCEEERSKYGIPVEQIWANDKDRCCFSLDNGHWAYGDQIDLLPQSVVDANF